MYAVFAAHMFVREHKLISQASLNTLSVISGKATDLPHTHFLTVGPGSARVMNQLHPNL